MNINNTKVDREVYHTIAEGKATGITKFARNFYISDFFTNTVAGIDKILTHPNFGLQEMIALAEKLKFRGVSNEDKGIFVKLIIDGITKKTSYDTNIIVRLTSGGKKILGLPYSFLNIPNFSSGKVDCETDELPVFAETMKEWATEYHKKYIQLRRTHDAYIKIPHNHNDLKRENGQIKRFIDTSLEELQETELHILALSKRPYALYMILKRVEREYQYITQERDELREKIIQLIEDSKQKKPTSISSTDIVIENNNKDPHEQELDKVSMELGTILTRLDTIGQKNSNRKRNVLVSADYTEEIEKIQERINLLNQKYPDFEEMIRYIHDQIMSIHGMQTAKTEIHTSLKINALLESKEQTSLSSTSGNEQDHYAGFALSRYIYYLAQVRSSTNNRSANSKGDGRTLNQILIPLFRFCINNLKAGKLQASNFSLGEVFREFQGIDLPTGNLQRSLQSYGYIFQKNNQSGHFVEVFPLAIEGVIREIGNMIQNGANTNGCGILLERTQEFFDSNEWKKICKEFPK